MIKVIITDDHKLFLEGLSAMFSREKYIQVIGTASNGKEALELLQQKDCDVILLDINMPEMDGRETAKEIIEKHPYVKVLILTMHDQMIMIERLLDIGVHGYVLKDSSKQELIDAVKKAYDGKEYFSPRVTEKLVENLRNKQSRTFSLTKREKDVLQLISEGAQTKEIADKLNVSVHTINTHRKNLLSKAGVSSAVDLVNWAREHEYVA